MIFAASTQITWYLTRSSGLVALVLLTVSVAIGVVTTGRWQAPAWPRFVTQAVHRNASLLAVAFLAAHVVTAVVDGYVPIRWIDAVVPLGSAYRPIWLGLGAIAFDLLIAVTVTSLVRRRLGYRAWRFVHLAAWAAWPVAVVHGLGTGSDTRTGWAQSVYIACALVTLVAFWCRLAIGWPAGAGKRVAAGVASLILPIIVLAWSLSGPLRPGWAKRAGTPATQGSTIEPASSADDSSGATGG
jgi:sulfoxide reductase heme-binding subunit YedZ